jgi:hypothetical protein
MALPWFWLRPTALFRRLAIIPERALIRYLYHAFFFLVKSPWQISRNPKNPRGLKGLLLLTTAFTENTEKSFFGITPEISANAAISVVIFLVVFQE